MPEFTGGGLTEVLKFVILFMLLISIIIRSIKMTPSEKLQEPF
jgi:hypothetical protein